jgi:hypothetical protein
MYTIDFEGKKIMFYFGPIILKNKLAFVYGIKSSSR